MCVFQVCVFTCRFLPTVSSPLDLAQASCSLSISCLMWIACSASWMSKKFSWKTNRRRNKKLNEVFLSGNKIKTLRDYFSELTSVLILFGDGSSLSPQRDLRINIRKNVRINVRASSPKICDDTTLLINLSCEISVYKKKALTSFLLITFYFGLFSHNFDSIVFKYWLLLPFFDLIIIKRWLLISLFCLFI